MDIKPFTVVEIQHNADGTTGILKDAYADKNAAESKYHTVLASAAISTVPVHTCTMLGEMGEEIKHECFYHQQPEPEES